MISFFNTLTILYAYFSLHLLRLITDVFTCCLNPYLTFACRRSVEPSLPSRCWAQYPAHSRKTIKVTVMYWKALSIVMKKWQGNTFSHLDVSNIREDRHRLNDMWLETAFTNQVSSLKPEWDTRVQQETKVQVVSLLGLREQQNMAAWSRTQPSGTEKRWQRISSGRQDVSRARRGVAGAMMDRCLGSNQLDAQKENAGSSLLDPCGLLAQ